MSAADIAVVLTGLVLIAVRALYFLTPRTAIRAHREGGRQVISSISVVLNRARLNRFRPPVLPTPRQSVGAQ